MVKKPFCSLALVKLSTQVFASAKRISGPQKKPARYPRYPIYPLIFPLQSILNLPDYP